LCIDHKRKSCGTCCEFIEEKSRFGVWEWKIKHRVFDFKYVDQWSPQLHGYYWNKRAEQEEAKAKLNHGRKLKRNREKNPYNAENSRARRTLRNLTVVDPEPEPEVIDLTKDKVIDLMKD